MSNEPLRNSVMGVDAGAVLDVVRRALTEDLGGDPGRDVTTVPTIGPEHSAVVHVVARADGVVAGMAVVDAALRDVARRLDAPVPRVSSPVADGTVVKAGDVLATIEGATQVILIAERTILNIMCRMSGVASAAALWTAELAGSGATVLDTRKTTPGLRALEKYAVRVGGGTNKRMGLYDVAMVKDNHKLAAGSVSAAYEAIRAAYPDVDVQVEVTTKDEALEAVAAGARFLLCDNMSVPQLRETVEAVRGACPDGVELEATGGLTLDVAAAYASTGVDYLSVGALTHSAGILDIAMDLIR